MTSIENYILPKFARDNLETLLKDVIKILDENGVSYWAINGTLLGLIRHENFIPWEDEHQLGILKEDEASLQSLKSTFEAYGYHYIEFKNLKLFKICRNDGYLFNDNKTVVLGNPCVDIYMYEIPSDNIKERDEDAPALDENDKLITLSGKSYAKKYGLAGTFRKGDLFPLSKYKYCDYMINAPRNPEPYLIAKYGDKWKSTFYINIRNIGNYVGDVLECDDPIHLWELKDKKTRTYDLVDFPIEY